MNPKLTKAIGDILNTITTKGAFTRKNVNPFRTPSTWGAYGGIVASVMQGPPQSIEDVALQAIFIIGSALCFFFRKPN